MLMVPSASVASETLTVSDRLAVNGASGVARLKSMVSAEFAVSMPVPLFAISVSVGVPMFCVMPITGELANECEPLALVSFHSVPR